MNANVSARRLLQREYLARGICQECCNAPRAVDAAGVRRVLCEPCRDRQNAARRGRALLHREGAKTL